MTTKVKICGLRTPETLDAALDAGAEYFGMVFYPGSPRNIGADQARALVDHAGARAVSVALLVDPDDGAIAEIVDHVAPAMLQLHGNETPDRVRDIREKWELPVIKAIRVGNEADARSSAAYDGISDMVLFDALPLEGEGKALPGGNGVPFDWEALRNMSREKRGFILSGGLTGENVRDAIAATGASFVDVSSGVERAPGEKDAELIRRFVAAAKSVG